VTAEIDAHRLAGGTSGTELMAHVAEFARWTKHAGTDEERRSLAYVERTIASYGYRTELIDHEAYISLPKAGSVRLGGETLRGIAHSFSCSTGPAGVRAPLIAVGGGREADFDRVDVRGKVVLVEGIASPAVSLLATRRGAVAQIHVSPHEHVHEMCISPVWGSPDDERRALLPGTAVVTVPLESGRRLGAALEDGEVSVTVVAEVDTGWRTTPILVAELGPPDGGDDDPFVLFTGHHDTWYYGVMDNGGANATMLEVARLCAQHHGSWRRGLRVVFWSGHSQGRYSSSAWYADRHWEELERRALVHVNVDSTGGLGNTVVSDTTAAAELAALATEVLAAEADQPFSGRRMQRAGDQSFWGIGVPAIFGNMSEQPASASETNASAAVFGGGARLGHGTGWWWHTPDDLADKMDQEILVRDTRIYAHAVWRLLTDPMLPLDYEAAAAELRDGLREVAEAMGERLDVGLALRRADRLVTLAGEFRSRVVAAGDDAAGANQVLRELSRVMVPLGYSGGDRFGHDPALGMGAIPALDDASRLASLAPGSDEFRFLRSRMVRAVNRVAYGLREACAVLERALEVGNAAGW
jgi:N-acetylated-alpha-linked acidic dipeptidase